MEAFGALLWIAATIGLAIVFGIVAAVNGFTAGGWARTNMLYVWASLITIGWPVVMYLQHAANQSGNVVWVLGGALRQAACLPLFMLGAALAIRAVKVHQPYVALVVTAILNLLVFVALYAAAGRG